MTVSIEMYKTTQWLKRESLEDSDAKAEVEKEVSDKDMAEEPEVEIEGSEKDGAAEVEIEVSLEDYKRIMDGAGGKIIDGFHADDQSGSYKRFVISGYDASTNPAAEATDNKLATIILMQNGLLTESGMNGVTIEDLLQVCEAIMEGYQEGKFKCEENGQALEHIQQALTVLKSRRARRDAEGTLDTHTGN